MHMLIRLDYNFLSYGESFERAKINGERLLNITRRRLNELGITRTDHQDILLKAVASICKKRKVEEPAMQEEAQNDKKMPTRFGKQSEHLEHAIHRVLGMISERRRARSLHGTNEKPPHNILTAVLELINVVKMILNILERPPFDCMSEFSSLKSHLIKHITLLKYFSEQTDLSHEMESDMIDVCKGVTKICHYIIALPPDISGPEAHIPALINPEEKQPRVQVPIAIEPEAMSFTKELGRDYMPQIQHVSKPITTTVSSCGPVSPFQYVPLSNQRVSDRFECFSTERFSTQSNEEAVKLQRDIGNKSETDVSDTKDSEMSGGSLDYKSLQDLTIIESDTPLMDSGSERCIIDSDSDRGIGSDYDLEQHSKDSSSVIWGTDSDSEKCPRNSLEVDSGSVEVLMESDQHLVSVESCQVDSASLKDWMDSGSEKCFGDSESEKYLMDSDDEKLGRDSDSSKFPIAFPSVKHTLKAETDSVKRMIESEKKLTETEKICMISASDRYMMDTERGRTEAASLSHVLLMGEEKPQKIRFKRYMVDSDSNPCEVDSGSERHELTSAAVRCLIDIKELQLSTHTEGLWRDSWSERQTLDLDSESLRMASDAGKHIKKAETCKSTTDLQRFWSGLKSESTRCWIDSERKQLDFNYGRHQGRIRRYQYRSVRLQDSSERSQDDQLKYWDDFENSDKCQRDSENERLQKDEGKERHLIEYGSEKEHRIALDCERHGLEAENEAERLGARRKDNRPKGFWRPVFLPLLPSQRKKTEEQYSVQQTDNRVPRIQLVRYLSDDKILRFKEASLNLSDKQVSQQKLKETQSHNLSPDSNTLVEDMHHKKVTRKVSVYKSLGQDYSCAQSFQSALSQINPSHLLSTESYTSAISVPVCTPKSISSKAVIHTKLQRNNACSLAMRIRRCPRCFMEINNPHFHKCFMNSDDDSDSDSPLHLQTPLDSKYSLSSKSLIHFKTSPNNSLSQSLDPKHPVGIQSSLHQEDTKYSCGSNSYLHCENCSSLQNIIGSAITLTFPMDSKNIMGQHNAPVPDNTNTSNVTGLESEGKFKPQIDGNPDIETKLSGTGNLKDKVNAKGKPPSKDETDHEDKTNSEDDTDAEDETDTEDEDNTKDKKDPKDKSDPDDTEPKDGNFENDPDPNNGSDPTGDADPTSGADSDTDGDPNNGGDPNSEPDPNIDNATNDAVSTTCSNDLDEDMYTNNSGNASDLFSGLKQENTADCNNGTSPNCASGSPNKNVLDYTSVSNNGAGPSNVTWPGNDICPNIGSGLQNIRSIINNFDHSNNDIDPSPQSNIPGLQKGPDSNYNAKPTSHKNAVSLNNDVDSNYSTRFTSATGHDYTAAPNYDSDTGFTHAVGSNFVVNTNYVDRNNNIARTGSAAITVNATDTNSTTSCSSAINPRYTDRTYSASDTTHVLRFTQFNIINLNYNAINAHNAYNSTINSNINNLLFSSSVSNIVNGNIPNFVADTNYLSTPDHLTTSELGRNYAILDDQKFGAHFKGSTGFMESAMFKHASRESGFLKYFPGVQNPIGVNGIASLKIHFNPNISLPSFNIVVEAEPPDVKFTISSDAVNQFFKLNLQTGSRQNLCP
ncbi:uncharacterized protein [Castor canadensis]|uniref:Uncharacterized protein n=1 Tax=Castor canadensis TaxID=51338 RepID=A0AC58LMH1_CASCN